MGSYKGNFLKPIYFLHSTTTPFSFKSDYVNYAKSRDISFGIAMAYGLDGRGSNPGRSKNFLFTTPRPTLGPTQPPIQWVPGLKRQGSEADHSPPSSAEVKSSGAIPLLPHTSSWRVA
jgi:hypothetical protein